VIRTEIDAGAHAERRIGSALGTRPDYEARARSGLFRCVSFTWMAL